MNTKFLCLICVISILVTSSLACGTFRKLSSAKRTAQALVTEVKGIATEIKQSGAMETAKAFSKEFPDLLKTAEAFATQNPNLIATGQFLATEAVQNPSQNEPPSDIPLLPQNEMLNYYGTREMVTFMTRNPFLEVLDFYKREMNKQDWQAIQDGIQAFSDIAVLNYEKGGKLCQIVININPADSKTVVLITVRPK